MSKGRAGSHLPLASALVATGVWTLVFAFGIAFGWPGERHACAQPPYCYCETVGAGPIGQPANTWSDLGFAVAAVYIAWRGGRRFDPGSAHPFRRRLSTPLLYSQVILFMGPGSMFFHGAMTEWGGRLDGLSMYLFILFVIAWQVARTWEWGQTGFLRCYALLVAIFAAERVLGGGSTLAIFGAMVTCAALLEILIALPRERLVLRRRRERRLDRRPLGAALALFALSMGIWALSDSGRPFCDPESWIQGHAIWHLLSAGTVTAIYRYLDSEVEG